MDEELDEELDDYNGIDVISVEPDGYYSGATISGGTVRVVLQRDNEFVSCKDIVLWDESLVDNDMFDEWVMMAQSGQEGYEYWTE